MIKFILAPSLNPVLNGAIKTTYPTCFHRFYLFSILRLNEDAKSTVFTQIVPVHHGAHNPMRIKLNHIIPSGR